jgi:hypothetical protein
MSSSEIIPIFRKSLRFRNSGVFTQKLEFRKNSKNLTDIHCAARISHHLKRAIQISASTDFDVLIRWPTSSPPPWGESPGRCRVEEQSPLARHQMITGDYTSKWSGIWIERPSCSYRICSDSPSMFEAPQWISESSVKNCGNKQLHTKLLKEYRDFESRL